MVTEELLKRLVDEMLLALKPPLHRAATFVPPLSDQKKWPGRSVVAQTQKVLFLCNCCSTTLVPSLNDQICCSGATGRAKEAEWRQIHCQGGWRVAVVAEWRHSSRHCDRSMDAIIYRPVSQMRAPSGGLSRTSRKLWQDYSSCYMFWT